MKCVVGVITCIIGIVSLIGMIVLKAVNWGGRDGY